MLSPDFTVWPAGPVLIHSSPLCLHTCPCLNVKQCDHGGFGISLLSKCVNFAVSCMWYHSQLSLRPVHQTTLWNPIHPFTHSEWDFEHQVLWVNRSSFFLLSVGFWSYQLFNNSPFLLRSPAFLPPHGGELCLMRGERWWCQITHHHHLRQ